MSAEILRRAAALMRERAEAAPVQTRTDADVTGVWLNSRFHLTTPPAVALAVADWLDAIASPFDSMWEADEDGVLWGYDFDGDPLRFADSTDSLALAVARAYLGEQA